MQVSESVALGRAEEATPFPLHLDEKMIISMMVDEPQTYEDLPSAPVIEEVSNKLAPKGTMAVEARKEVK